MQRIIKLLDELNVHLTDTESLMAQMPGCTAEEILVESEKRKEIIELMKEIVTMKNSRGKLLFNRKDRKILWLYILKGKSYRQISAIMNLKFQNVQIKIDNFHKRIQKNLDKTMTISHKYNMCRKTLLDNPSMKEANSPQVKMAWLCQSLQKVNIGGEFVRSHHTFKVYKSKTKCLLPEYLNKSFGSKTFCSFCNAKCSRKLDN